MWRAANTAAGYKFLVTSTQPCFVAPCATAKDGGSAGFAGAKNLPTARDGGSAGFAGAKNLPTARMAEVPEMQEQFPGKAGVQILFGLPAAGRETSFGLDTGLRRYDGKSTIAPVYLCLVTPAEAGVQVLIGLPAAGRETSFLPWFWIPANPWPE